jgi:hypothetical protein
MIHISDLQYFPSITYINALYKLSNVVFTSTQPFKKSTFRNKMHLAGANGVQNLSIPIKGGRTVKLDYAKVEPDDRVDWQTNHFRTIKTIYGSSPYFQLYEDALRDLYIKKPSYLFEWNLSCLDFFIRFAKMSNMIQLNTILDDISGHESVELSSEKHFLTADHLYPSYHQVFKDKTGFQPNMSCLDLLMNLGPDSSRYILDLSNKLH